MVFQNLSFVSGGSIQQSSWSFGDGTGLYPPQDTAYVYAQEGAYDVILTVTSNKGCVDSVSKQVNVFPRAEVNFIADSVCIGESILFINTTQTTSSTISYLWNFDDGNTSDITNPLYTYQQPGTYNVNLQTNVPGGCVDSKTNTVVIYPEPVADFIFTDKCLYD